MTVQHHQLIASLVSEIRRLRQDLGRANNDLGNALAENESVSWDAYRAEERASQARREAEYQASEASRAQEEAEYRDYQRQDALKDMEQARERKNDWEERQALRRVKDWS